MDAVVTEKPMPAAISVDCWRVVVVDDSIDDRTQFRRLLLRGSDRRYIFFEAATGSAGIAEILKAGHLPDCVLLDFSLPDMDAVEVLAALVGADGLPLCAVLVLTGGNVADAGRKVLQAGAQDYISKAGLTPLGLTRAVENSIERLMVARGMLARDAALVRSQRELQTLADNTPDVLTRFDGDLRHVFVNAAFEKLTGRKRIEFIGKTQNEAELPAALCVLWSEAMRSVFASGAPVSLAFKFETPQGTRHFAAQIVPEFGQYGQVDYVLGVAHDVTVGILYEKALSKADQRKDEFIATLAHELRNPLAPMLSGLQVLRLTSNTQPPHPTLDMMDRQLSQMARLIDDLLDMSRISSDKVLLRIERVTVGSVVAAAVETVRPVVEARHHVFVLDLPTELLWLDADPTRLAQVIGNLINNAAKYSNEGGHVAVAVRREGEHVVIQVSDLGMGIPHDMLLQVFDMFVQVRDTPSRTEGGLGIGLALVKRLVEMHGGSVNAESAGIGMGSSFTVRLPLASAPARGAVGTLHSALESPQPRGRKILVVDDNVDGATTLAEMLSLSGHETSVAFTGREALEMAARTVPEVIFLDIGLPDMTGYQVARQLRAMVRHRHVLLVAVTGWGSEADKRRAREAGFDFHLTKPVEPAAFDRLLAQLDAPIP